MTARFGRRFVSAPALLLVMASLVMLMPGGAGMSRAAQDASLQGDVNCDTAVSAVDSLQILRDVAGLGTTAGCLADAGDVNCDDATDSVDSLRILRHVAGLSNTTPDGCISIGEPLGPLTPQVLAAWIYAAPNDEARYSALLKVMELLRIGVYTSEGGEVQQGAESGPGDFYLYDFELRMMAASLGRRDNSWGAQQIAATLDQAGYREDGQPFTGDNLNQVLHQATNDSLATPDEASSMLQLLVRELGLRHETPYDLADELDVNEASFDGLQVMLILAGLTLPVIADEAPLDTAAATLVAESNGILTAQPVGVTDTCSDFKGEKSVYVPKVFSVAVSIVSAVAKKAVSYINIIHGEQLALSVQVKSLDSSVGPTHYDHESPGQPLKFRIEVRMLDDLGETLVKCGWLATADYPPQGPIPGVKVAFESIQTPLKDHGTLDCTGLLCERTTGTDGEERGIATLTFDPKSEAQPYGQGIEQEVSGVISGVAWYQSKFNNIYGTVAQLLVPKYGSTRWFVRYHGCPGAAAAAPLAAGGPAPQAQSGESVSIEAIASLDQLPCEWTGTSHGSIHYYSDSYEYDVVGQVDGTFTFGNRQVYSNGVEYEIVSGSATWQETGQLGVPGQFGYCSWSKSGTEGTQGGLTVIDDGSGQLMYHGWGDVIVYTPTGCPQEMSVIAARNFFRTCEDPSSLPLTGLDLSGSCQIDRPPNFNLVTEHEEYNWHLSGISCTAVTPEGSCGGP